MVGRKVCSAIVWLWVSIVSLCKTVASLLLRRQQVSPGANSKQSMTGNVGTSPATGQEMEWEESWNTMEPFSVTVVPTDSDLFQDMQPVLTKTRKVYVGGEVADEKRPDKRKFAVEAEFIGQVSRPHCECLLKALRCVSGDE
ncbi:hypothetical protein GBAR_LOCUS13988 [Geodia barretti]|uniref:Uncharacterized protein n=1 Tax=Geodia barretti TaxID=519541 RepID=A0AA35WJQ9_GEOBA|nr:hypothetical protein GBAR_LOCUS13988 [Geodia barretti]